MDQKPNPSNALVDRQPVPYETTQHNGASRLMNILSFITMLCQLALVVIFAFLLAAIKDMQLNTSDGIKALHLYSAGGYVVVDNGNYPFEIRTASG